MSVDIDCPCGNKACGISRGDRKWVEHLPHEGWVYHGCFVDMKGLKGKCGMCDNDIRYMHEITHEPTDIKLGVGCVCAKYLCIHSTDSSMKVYKVRDEQKQAEQKFNTTTKEKLRTTLEQLTWKNCKFESKSGNKYIGQESSFKVNQHLVLVSVYRGLHCKGRWYWSVRFHGVVSPAQRRSSSGSFGNSVKAWRHLKKSLYQLFGL